MLLHLQAIVPMTQPDQNAINILRILYMLYVTFQIYLYMNGI